MSLLNDDYSQTKPDPELCDVCGGVVIDNGEHVQLPDKSRICNDCIAACAHPKEERDDNYCMTCGQNIGEFLVAEAESLMENR